MWWLKIRRDISVVEVPLWEVTGPSPHQAPQARVPVTGREVPLTSGCENQLRLWLRRERLQSQVLLLKGLNAQTYLLTDSLGAAAQKVTGTDGEEVSCLSSGRELEGQLSCRQEMADALLLCCSCPLTACRRTNADIIPESPSSWLTLLAPPYPIYSPPKPVSVNSAI